jgi:hypothetical protein
MYNHILQTQLENKLLCERDYMTAADNLESKCNSIHAAHDVVNFFQVVYQKTTHRRFIKFADVQISRTQYEDKSKNKATLMLIKFFFIKSPSVSFRCVSA